MKLLALVAMLLGSAVATDEKEAQDWTQWRGKNRDSVVNSEWPGTLDESNLKLIWSKPFQPSYSGPILLGDTLFTTETRDKKEEVVYALDAATGSEKWTTNWSGAMSVPFFAAKNGSWIRATPATDGERLFVGGMLGRFACLDVKTGKEIWSVDFPKKFNVPREDFGHVCSPLIIDDNEDNDTYLYIQCAAGFLKMDRLTGKVVWRTLEGGGGSMMSRGAFSSPIAAELSGKKQLVVQTRTHLAGVDIESGDVLWKQPVPNFRGMNILTPSVYGDLVFTSPYNFRSFGFEVKKTGDQFAVSEKWTAPSKCYMSSPVIVGDNAFMHLQNKRIASINLASGNTNWVSSERFGDYWSMVTNGKKILALDSKGALYLMNPNPEKFDIVGKVNLETNDSWAHLAVVGNRIYVRGLRSMSVYEWTK